MHEGETGRRRAKGVLFGRITSANEEVCPVVEAGGSAGASECRRGVVQFGRREEIVERLVQAADEAWWRFEGAQGGQAGFEVRFEAGESVGREDVEDIGKEHSLDQLHVDKAGGTALVNGVDLSNSTDK